MCKKTITHVKTKQGASDSVSAPNWFVSSTENPASQDPGLSSELKGIKWGDVFSAPSSGNKVQFFVTGSSYFTDVAKAIDAAATCIFIAGWQVNFDVDMGDGKTLFEHLRRAVERGVEVFVMPWLSPPPLAFDTCILETLFGLNQLNAGLKQRRAWTLPAVGQSDIAGGLGLLGFSHHQKMVVVDNKIGYMGGMDLAYGRRDDGTFNLAAEGRKGNEFYSTCIPKIATLSREEQTGYVPLTELLTGCFPTTTGKVAAWWFSPLDLGPVNSGLDWVNEKDSQYKEIAWRVQSWWDSSQLVPAFVKDAARQVSEVREAIQDASGEAVQWLARRTWDYIDPGIRQELLNCGADVAAAVTWLIDWLRGGHLDALSPNVYKQVGRLIETLGVVCATSIADAACQRDKPLPDLIERRKAMPYKGKTHDVKSQPRMPWHDVHMRIEGPAVFELATNFVSRWDGQVKRYCASRSVSPVNRPSGVSKPPSSAPSGVASETCAALPAYKEINLLLRAVGLTGASASAWSGQGLPILMRKHAPQRQAAKSGTQRAQLLRSASLQMRQVEFAANSKGEKPTRPQNNCMKAMLKAIGGAQHFIYIEGQFFQSAYGKDAASDYGWSGPMAALRDPWAAKNGEAYMNKLGLQRGMPLRDIPRKINLAKLKRVVREANKDDAFLADFDTNLSNLAKVETFNLLGKAQERLENPIGHALAARIRRAILEDLPFHVYMVLPVHPEGQLDAINVMSQVHLTMQSLVFGHDSLVNNVRRAILERKARKENPRMSEEERVRKYEALAAMDPADLQNEVPKEWQSHFTLLNLRHWATLGGKAVTEQVYVHSKLLITDDRVAILGSANINDRSLLGTRDSELAMVIADTATRQVLLDGKTSQPVGKVVHELRVSLWKKLFGLSGNCAAPASELAGVIDRPASPATWAAIQKRGRDNAEAYRGAFSYVPYSVPDTKLDDPDSSIWPTWDKKTRKLKERMPFLETFWRKPAIGDKPRSWEASVNPRTSAPSGVAGFICALPFRWTANENNFSGLNLTLLANNGETPSGHDPFEPSRTADALVSGIGNGEEASTEATT